MAHGDINKALADTKLVNNGKCKKMQYSIRAGLRGGEAILRGNNVESFEGEWR